MCDLLTLYFCLFKLKVSRIRFFLQARCLCGEGFNNVQVVLYLQLVHPFVQVSFYRILFHLKLREYRVTESDE